jgi:hypothetical protein
MSLAALQAAADSASAAAETAIADTCAFAGGSCDVMGTLGSLSPEIGDVASSAQESISKMVEPLAGVSQMLTGAVDNLKSEIAAAIPNIDPSLPFDSLPIDDLSSLGGDLQGKIAGLTSSFGEISGSIASSVSESLGSLEGALAEVRESISFSLDVQGGATCPALNGVLEGLPAGVSPSIDSITGAAAGGGLGESANAAAAAAANNMKSVADQSLANTNALMSTIGNSLGGPGIA